MSTAGNAIFFELTRSLCPECRRVIDAQIWLQDGHVIMKKRCPDHGPFQVLVYADSEAYVRAAKYNKPGQLPLQYSTPIKEGCPHDCGLCPDHAQHVCVGIIEVNTACNMACPLCFADAGAGYNLTLDEVGEILDHLVATEGHPEVVQFSGGEPSIHPDILPMLRLAKERGVRHVMINTNGKRIAEDDAFLRELSEIKPGIYFQFDGFLSSTYRTLRGEEDLLATKLKALDRLAEAGLSAILVPAIERGVNEHEVGDIIRFGLKHPAVRGINFQPAFHAGRHGEHDPMQRMTIPDVLRLIAEETHEVFCVDDFTPVPCCFPTCNSVTYAYVEGDTVLPLTRLLNMDDYLDYIANRVLPEVGPEQIQSAVEQLWSSAAVPGTSDAIQSFAIACSACGMVEGTWDPAGLLALKDRMFMVMLQDFMDPWTFNQKNVMKCCKEILLPGGKQIPFCAYNSVGYREQARDQLAIRHRQQRLGQDPAPLTFRFEPGRILS